MAEHTPVAWEAVTSPSDPELYAVQGAYLVADHLPIEDALKIAAAPDLLTALINAIGALEQDYEQGKEYGDSDWEGLAFQRLSVARAAIAKAGGVA